MVHNGQCLMRWLIWPCEVVENDGGELVAPSAARNDWDLIVSARCEPSFIAFTLSSSIFLRGEGLPHPSTGHVRFTHVHLIESKRSTVQAQTTMKGTPKSKSP